MPADIPLPVPLSTFRLYQKKNNQEAIKAVLLVSFPFFCPFRSFLRPGQTAMTKTRRDAKMNGRQQPTTRDKHTQRVYNSDAQSRSKSPVKQINAFPALQRGIPGSICHGAGWLSATWRLFESGLSSGHFLFGTGLACNPERAERERKGRRKSRRGSLLGFFLSGEAGVTEGKDTAFSILVTVRSLCWLAMSCTVLFLSLYSFAAIQIAVVSLLYRCPKVVYTVTQKLQGKSDGKEGKESITENDSVSA